MEGKGQDTSINLLLPSDMTKQNNVPVPVFHFIRYNLQVNYATQKVLMRLCAYRIRLSSYMCVCCCNIATMRSY